VARIRIGISGWRYPGWRGVFYPKGLPQRHELDYASRRFDTVEINGSFYSLQRPGLYAAWRETAPKDCVFAVKGGRFITHMKKLRGIETPLANFFASGILALKEKLGPILWQFPPSLAFDPERFAAFFALLPRDTTAASSTAARHDARLAGRAFLGPVPKRRIRHAVEIRHESFKCREFVRLLRRHRIALVFADGAGFPYVEDVTADFVYLRLRGAEELYASGYSAAALDRWAGRVSAWANGGEPTDRSCIDRAPAPKRRGRDVYVYFDNDAKVRAPFDAIALRERVASRK
jgi:uncharacterized protein YecE (DUF72 family)